MSATATLSADAIGYVCTLVRQRSAIELDVGKTYLIEARLNPLARRLGFPTTADMIQRMQALPKLDLQQQVVEAMTTNETSFFRDNHPFEALRTSILPEILQTRPSEKTINIWSAACSTGQEAYSIAMLWKEHFGTSLDWNLRITGTDLCDEVLEKARAGRFSQIEMNRGLPAAYIPKYFRREGLQWEIQPQIRSHAAFHKLNLIERWPPMPRMDVVFLRNVLIYFSPETKKAILERVRSVMAPHAVLFLGAAETTMGLDAAFNRVQIGNSVFYRLR